MAAYGGFEIWRCKHIEAFEEEDAIQAQVNSMPERQRVRAVGVAMRWDEELQGRSGCGECALGL